jgi:hypothetical protein
MSDHHGSPLFGVRVWVCVFCCCSCVHRQAEERLNARAESLKKKTLKNSALVKEEIKAGQAAIMAKREQ